MLDAVILHIPHAGLALPARYLGDILVPDDMLRLNISCDADLYVDQLFEGDVLSLKPQFGRYACDVERFRDDNEENESKRGRGLYYTHFEDGRQFRKYNIQARQRVLEELYEPHHTLFTQEVKSKLQAYGKCCIIDCHSFSNKLGYPDFCIGTDNFHTPTELQKRLQNFIEMAGYGVQINFPYSGCIVPTEYYQKDGRVKSIMIEVNKRLYLDETTFSKSNGFNDIRKLCHDMIGLIASYAN